MSTSLRFAIGGAVVTLGVMLDPMQVFAQALPGCTLGERDDPPRIVHDCGGLVIEAEAAATLRPASAEGGVLDAVEVDGSALLIDIAPGRAPFQILTPHAIASVRGTVYVVDVGADRTSVFVVEGQVGVTRADGDDPVELGAGDGVDVAAGEPLTVRQWPSQRVEALLARFGR